MRYCDVKEIIPVSVVWYKDEYIGARKEQYEKATTTILGDVDGKTAKKAILLAFPKRYRTGVVVRSIQRSKMAFAMSTSKFIKYSVPFDPETGEPLQPFPLTPRKRHYDNKLQRYFSTIITPDGTRIGG